MSDTLVRLVVNANRIDRPQRPVTRATQLHCSGQLGTRPWGGGNGRASQPNGNQIEMLYFAHETKQGGKNGLHNRVMRWERKVKTGVLGEGKARGDAPTEG